ncbi:GntR family transcriptional regulator [Sodalis ligni]|uniref:GntR family transcriptional regulator n=1 Tax=Sodalis ligni TaxID=2697027 RepID=UPI00193F2FA2|nr:GntR family transcriptional regulator [Sodalis ligni]QWA09281.1 GntR family transcriptional regulator [Sodalis ligni]
MENELEQAAPLYLHIARGIRQRIEFGDYPLGSLLPPEGELCRAYRCGRATLRAAVELLAHRGYLVKKQGRGTTVTLPPWLADPSLPVGFSDKMAQLDLRHHTVILHDATRQPGAEQGRLLGLSGPEPVLALTLLRYVEGHPALYEEILLPAARFTGLDRDKVARNGLYDTLARDYNLLSMRAWDDYRPVAAPPEIARHLNLPAGQPCIEITRLSRSRDIPFELTVSHTNTEYYPLRFHYLRG